MKTRRWIVVLFGLVAVLMAVLMFSGHGVALAVWLGKEIGIPLLLPLLLIWMLASVGLGVLAIALMLMLAVGWGVLYYGFRYFCPRHD